MTLIDKLKPVCFKTRGIAGKLGARPFRVKVIKVTYDGDVFAGAEQLSTVITELTEGGDYPPKVRELNANDYLRGANPDAVLRVGPITPEHLDRDGNPQGNSYEFLEQLSAEKGSQIYYEVSGRQYGEGSRFLLDAFHGERSLGYFIDLKRTGNE